MCEPFINMSRIWPLLRIKVPSYCSRWHSCWSRMKAILRNTRRGNLSLNRSRSSTGRARVALHRTMTMTTIIKLIATVVGTIRFALRCRSLMNVCISSDACTVNTSIWIVSSWWTISRRRSSTEELTSRRIGVAAINGLISSMDRIAITQSARQGNSVMSRAIQCICCSFGFLLCSECDEAITVLFAVTLRHDEAKESEND